MPNSSDEEYVQCPYNVSHHIRKFRFPIHLVKCRNNHKNVPKKTCPFDATHVVNEPELDWHIKNCDKRASFENFKYRDASTTNVNPSTDASGPSTSAYYVPSDENWDDEPDVASYDPQSYAANAPVLRALKGQPKSVKKEFREQERRRHLGLDRV